MKARWLALILLSAALPLQADVFKWVDADGKIQYGDVPPKGVSATKVSGGVTVMPAFTPPPASASKPAPKSTQEERETVRGGISAKAERNTTTNPEVPALTPREEARRKMMEACLANRGANCDAEVDAQLNGQGGTVFVPIPGWSKPPIRPAPRPQPVTEQSKPAAETKRLHSNSSAGSKSDRL